jgi:glycosyltransferase involved in cell wall biosynthesis
MKLLSVVIPVYNEKGTIEEIVRRVEAIDSIPKELILVDDGSKDGTREILANLAKQKPYLKVILKELNEGKGAALREGFKHSTGDYVIVQDADLEYDPNDYKKLIAAIDGEESVVYGSRFSGNYKDMTGMHYLGNKVLTIITNILYGVKLTDMETCYKLVPGGLIRSMTITSNRFDFEPEITSKLLKSKKKIIEVPINYVGRNWQDGKKITWKDGLHAVKTLLKYRFSN